MAGFIDKIRDISRRVGIANLTRKSLSWLRKKIQALRTNPRQVMKSGMGRFERPEIGSMYFYYYDPKHKAKLPYYDRFPLTVVIEKYKDGFLGLNLHYLSPKQRAALLDRLMDYASDKNLTDKTKLMLSYRALKGASRMRVFRPCVKRYLYSQLRSRTLRIPPEQWMAMVFLPLARFEKASNSQVWSDSRMKM